MKKTEYVRLTFTPAGAKRPKTVWAKDLGPRTIARVAAHAYEHVNRFGDEIRENEIALILVAEADGYTAKPARMNLTYAELEIVK